MITTLLVLRVMLYQILIIDLHECILGAIHLLVTMPNLQPHRFSGGELGGNRLHGDGRRGEGIPRLNGIAAEVNDDGGSGVG